MSNSGSSGKRSTKKRKEKKKGESSLHLKQRPGMKKTEMMMRMDELMIQL